MTPSPSPATDDGGWTYGDTVALTVGLLAAVIAIGSLQLQYGLWRNDGPRMRVDLLPAVKLTDGNVLVGPRLASLAPGVAVGELVSVTLFSTGRQAVHVEQVRFENAHPLTPFWPTPFWPPWRKRLRRMVHMITDSEYMGNARPDRLEATERRDLVVGPAGQQLLARAAQAKGKREGVRAVVKLGNGKTVRSAPYKAL